MDTTIRHSAFMHGEEVNANQAVHNNVIAQKILYVLYIIIPIAAGADKFFNLLTDWTKYINPIVLKIIPVNAAVFMKAAGIVEIAAGILVAIKPKIGAYIVSLWLILIALQLLAAWNSPDVAVRDIAMAAGAYCLALLSKR